jgi:rubrerythrin
MKTQTEYLIARLVQFNNKAEAQAIEDYVNFLNSVAESDLPMSDKEYITNVINEIIADELNHQEKLQDLFTGLTDIEPNKD